MNDSPVESVVILGNDVVAWSAALALIKNLPMKKVRITLVDEGVAQPPKAESSWHTMRSFLHLLGLNERQVMADAGAGFKLGQEYSINTHRSFNTHCRFVHGFGVVGADYGGLSFGQIAMYLHNIGEQKPYEACSLSAIAGAHGKFIHPDSNPASILSTLNYGVHFEHEGYARHLATAAQAGGVEHLTGVLAQVNLHPETGFIQSLQLEDGRSITGDLFLDCTNAQAKLIGDVFNITCTSWEKYLPCTKRQFYFSEKTNEYAPLTKINDTSDGWHRGIPLRNRYFHELTFCGNKTNAGEFARQDQALEDVSAIMTLQPGFRSHPWYKNCIAIGDSAGYAGDLAVSPLHLAQSAIARLLDYFPGKACQPELAAEYNRITIEEWSHVRDFHSLHYYLHCDGGRSSENLFRDIGFSDTLLNKLEVFESSGRVPVYEEETLTEGMWIAFLLNANIWPKDPAALVGTFPPDTLINHHARILSLVERAAQQLPPHNIYLENYISKHKTRS